jgi:hypothetical protein
MPTLGAGTTRFWKTSSLRINHKLQATPLKRKSTLLECLLELTLQELKISSGQDGGPGHAITSLTTHQQNLAIAHSKKICFVDSWMPHSLHSIGPDQYIFFNCSADWILSCMTCQRKIFIFKGTLVFHGHNIHLSENPVNVSSLYKEEVVNFPDLSNTHLAESCEFARWTLAIISINSLYSRFSLSPKFLLKVNSTWPWLSTLLTYHSCWLQIAKMYWKVIFKGHSPAQVSSQKCCFTISN